MTEQQPHGIGTRVQLTQSALRNNVTPSTGKLSRVHTGTVIGWTVVQEERTEYAYRIDWDDADDTDLFNQEWVEPIPPQDQPQLQVGARVRITDRGMLLGVGPAPDQRNPDHTGPITGFVTHVDNTKMLDGTYEILYRVRWADAKGTDTMHLSWLEQIASPHKPPHQPVIFHPRTRDETTP